MLGPASAHRGQPDKAAAELSRELGRPTSLDEASHWFPQQTIAVVALSRATVFDSLVKTLPERAAVAAHWRSKLGEGDVDAARDAAAHTSGALRMGTPASRGRGVWAATRVSSNGSRLRPKDWNPSWSTDLLLLTPSAEPITSELLSAAEQMLKSIPKTPASAASGNCTVSREQVARSDGGVGISGRVFSASRIRARAGHDSTPTWQPVRGQTLAHPIGVVDGLPPSRGLDGGSLCGAARCCR